MGLVLVWAILAGSAVALAPAASVIRVGTAIIVSLLFVGGLAVLG